MAKTAQVPPPKIIAKDDDEVGFLGGVLGSVHRDCGGAAVTDGLDEQEATNREEDKGDAELSHRRNWIAKGGQRKDCKQYTDPRMYLL